VTSCRSEGISALKGAMSCYYVESIIKFSYTVGLIDLYQALKYSFEKNISI